ALEGELWRVYRANDNDEPYAASARQIAQRSLKNVCLAYLMKLETADAVSACSAQFRRGANMTDVMAALVALVNSGQRVAKESALAQFYQRWSDEPLVVNLWFQVQ